MKKLVNLCTNIWRTFLPFYLGKKLIFFFFHFFAHLYSCCKLVVSYEKKLWILSIFFPCSNMGIFFPHFATEGISVRPIKFESLSKNSDITTKSFFISCSRWHRKNLNWSGTVLVAICSFFWWFSFKYFSEQIFER